MLIFLALYAVLFAGYGLNAFHAAFTPGPDGGGVTRSHSSSSSMSASPVLMLLAIGGKPGALFTVRANSRSSG